MPTLGLVLSEELHINLTEHGLSGDEEIVLIGASPGERPRVVRVDRLNVIQHIPHGAVVFSNEEIQVEEYAKTVCTILDDAGDILKIQVRDSILDIDRQLRDASTPQSSQPDRPTGDHHVKPKQYSVR